METGVALKTETCLYLYGVIAASTSNLRKLERDHANLGISAVCFGDLACLVSSAPASEYSDNSQRTGAEQLEWIAPRALRHHNVLQQLQHLTTVVPFKFGTICATPEHVREVIDRFHTPLLDLLARFDGREEWTIAITADEGTVLQQIRENDPQVLALEAANGNPTPGEEYFLRKKIQKLSVAATENFLGLLAQDIESRLRDTNIEMRTQSLAAARLKLSLPVFSAALLIEKGSIQFVEQALAQIEGDYSCYKLCAELAGPWPAYDFTGGMGELGK